MTIAELNDQLRQGFGLEATNNRDRILMTSGIEETGEVIAIIRKVRNYTDFDENNDPHGEHDFGSFEHEGAKVFWKIDYYDADMEFASSNPADPSQTTRVLTIMLAEEY